MHVMYILKQLTSYRTGIEDAGFEAYVHLLITYFHIYHPHATKTVAHGGQTGLKVFLFKNLLKPPIYPQVAIKSVLKNVK